MGMESCTKKEVFVRGYIQRFGENAFTIEPKERKNDSEESSQPLLWPSPEVPHERLVELSHKKVIAIVNLDENYLSKHKRVIGIKEQLDLKRDRSPLLLNKFKQLQHRALKSFKIPV